LGMRTRGGWYTVRNNWFHNQIGSIRGSTLTYFGRGLKMRIPSKDVDVVGNIFWNIGNNPIQRREHAQDEPHSVNITGNTIICDRGAPNATGIQYEQGIYSFGGIMPPVFTGVGLNNMTQSNLNTGGNLGGYTGTANATYHVQIDGTGTPNT